MNKNYRRLTSPSFGYRGASLNHSNSYTFKRRVPFSKIKEIYGDELERFELESTKTSGESNILSTQQKMQIRERVRKQYKKEKK